MTHKIKIEHRTIEGLLSSLVGAAAIGAFMQGSWTLAGATVVLLAVLLIIEKRDLEDEDDSVREMENRLVLGPEVIAGLLRRSRMKFSSGPDPTYTDGLADGCKITAEYALGCLSPEEEPNAEV